MEGRQVIRGILFFFEYVCVWLYACTCTCGGQLSIVSLLSGHHKMCNFIVPHSPWHTVLCRTKSKDLVAKQPRIGLCATMSHNIFLSLYINHLRYNFSNRKSSNTRFLLPTILLSCRTHPGGVNTFSFLIVSFSGRKSLSGASLHKRRSASPGVGVYFIHHHHVNFHKLMLNKRPFLWQV